MPKISEKGLQMPASPIRKLTPFADKAKLDGKKVYHLNIGQPDIETPEGMLNAIKNIDFKVWAYTASEGTLAYRKKLTEYYNKLGYNITPENILVTTGGSEAITIAMMTCLNPGDEVIMRRDGDRLILQPIASQSLLELLATLEPIDEEFPEIEELPHTPVDL